MPKPYIELPEDFARIAACNPSSILLHTARCTQEDAHSYLFLAPSATLVAHHAAELPVLFAALERAVQQGHYAAGFVSYEHAAHASLPLAWFGIYAEPCIFDHRTGATMHPPTSLTEAKEDAHCSIGNLRFNYDEENYAQRIDAIHEWIRCGDTYQVNFTGKLHFDFAGTPLALYQRLLAQQPVSYAALINLGAQQILSCSPELFFRVQRGEILTRPMKGTCARGRTNQEDAQAAAWLTNDTKNRSENVMIVDLLRSDLGRICEFGSVHVRDLFAVEKYDRLFQMVSTVTGTLRSNVTPANIFEALFPSGSITGAPKLRTMEIINALEEEPRGIYTGAIGYFAPDGSSAFNVAIRTAVLDGAHGEMGVGGGITMDSRADDEYRECMLKADFLCHHEEDFALIESLLWDGASYPLLDLHLDRLEDSARYFDYFFAREDVRAQLLEATAELHDARKVRLTLARNGAVQITHSPRSNVQTSGRIALAPARTDSRDRFLFHKTTRRSFYNAWFQKAQRHQLDDVIFMNEHAEITEGCISNLWVERKGALLTPPLSCGLLNGVYRRMVLEQNPQAREEILTREDLRNAEAIYLCNAVRGMRRVQCEDISFIS